MSYLGAIAVIIGVYMIWREYSLFTGREVLVCRSFSRAVMDYREKMICYMVSPGDWAENYSDECLSEMGFLESLREGANFKEAYGAVCDKLCITDELNSVLSGCFDRLGEGYLETELKTLDVAIEKLRCEEIRLSESVSKRRKATGAVLGAFAVGTVILII